MTVNSKALELAGITKDTPNPQGGVIVRDPATGEATGVLLENAAYLVRRILPPPPPPAEHRRAAQESRCASSIRSASSAWSSPASTNARSRSTASVHDAGEMTVRTDVLFRALKQEPMSRRASPRSARRRTATCCASSASSFRSTAGSRARACIRPYRIVPGEQPNPTYRGVLLLPPGGEDEYVEGLKLIAEAGLQAQTHAVGDETIDVIVRAYERVNREKPIRDLRWTIMHIFHPADAAIKKMAEIGILATVQDHPVLLGHNQRRWWGDERAADAIPIRKLIDAGVLVGGGTDGPVVPVDPFLSMWWMTTRQVLKGYVLGREHAITAKEALQLYTINNARILGVEKERGSIEAGKLADLAVLSQDILAVPPTHPQDQGADDRGRRQDRASRRDLAFPGRGQPDTFPRYVSRARRAAKWCAADPGPTSPNLSASRISGAPLRYASRCTASGTHLFTRAPSPPAAGRCHDTCGRSGRAARRRE